MPVEFHPGVKPNDPARPRLYFSAFRKAGATPPASVDYSNIPVIGMLGNDRYGDCVFAGNGHTIEEQTFFGQGTEYQVSEADALAAYTRVTGFNPNDPSTDNGAEIQAGLDDLRKVGFGGHKLTAFAQLDPKNMTDVKLAVSEFGAVAVGMAFPNVAMSQFNAGQPWDVVANDGGIEGGHRVTLVGYDANYLYVFTWNAVQRMTQAFWDKYVEEAWAHVGPDWISAASGVDPEGVDKYAFGAQYAALTGQPNPFPAPTPTPTPAPVPVPVPTPVPTPAPVPAPVPPVLDAAETALLKAARRYLASLMPRSYMVKALRAWMADKGQH